MSVLYDSAPFQRQSWLGLDQDPRFNEDEFFLPNARRAEGALGLLVRRNLLDPTKAGRILDWGAGYGASTFAITKFAELNGSEVWAVENQARKAEILRNSGILPAEQVVEADGLDFLTQAADGGLDFDLIAACMYFDGKCLVPRSVEFVEAARQALTPDGKLMVYSDYTTMSNFKHRCRGAGIPPSRLFVEPLIEGGGAINTAVFERA